MKTKLDSYEYCDPKHLADKIACSEIPASEALKELCSDEEIIVGSTGIRLSELRKVRPEDIHQNKDGSCSIFIHRQNGVHSIVPALGNEPIRIAAEAKAAGKEFIFEDGITKTVPFHLLRKIYATALYDQLAAPLKDLPRAEKLYCRGQNHGIVLHRRALQNVAICLQCRRLHSTIRFLILNPNDSRYSEKV